MATIPSAEELGFRTPQAVSKGATMPQISMKKDLAAAEQTELKKGLAEVEERIGNEELAKAEVQFQIGAMAEAEKYKNDPDLDTIEERHAAGMQDQLGKASAMITSAKTRELFMIRGEQGVAKANSVMSEKTTARKNDREKGYMANAIDLMVKGGKDLEYGDPGEAAVGIRLTLDSMVERGVVSREDAEQTMRKAELDMAYGRLKAMSPEQQLEILNTDDPKIRAWLDDVPPDVLRQLKEQAEDQGMNDAALLKAFEMKDMDEHAGLAELERQFVAREINDQEYEKARLRFQRVKNDEEVKSQELLDDYYEEGMAEIYGGGTTIKQLEGAPGGIEMMKNLSPAQRANMFAAEDEAMERAAGRGRKYSDQEVVNQLQHYMANDQVIKGRKYWSENYARLNMSDFKYFNVATSPTKSTAPEWKPTRSARQLLTEYKKENDSMTDKDSSDIWDRIDVKSLKYFNENQGKEAPDEMVNGWIDEEFIKIKHKKNWWPDEEKFLWEMGETGGLQRDEVVQQIDFLEKATGFSRADTGDLLSGYSQEHYEFVPKMNEALQVVRQRFPNEKPYQHWARIKNMLGIDKKPEPVQIPTQALEAGGPAA